MINYEALEREKKATKIFYRTARIAGYGAGCFVLALVMPLINKTDITGALQDLFVKYGIFAMACAVLMLVTYLFIRKHIFTMHFIMQWVILPSIAIALALDVYGVMTNVQAPIDVNIPISDPREE